MKLAYELRNLGLEPLCIDPILASSGQFPADLASSELPYHETADVLVLAVPHDAVLTSLELGKALAKDGLLIDIQGAIPTTSVPDGVTRWAL